MVRNVDPHRRGTARQRRSPRGQTTLDFVVGVSVFLLALALVFAFVPGMFAPFEGDQETSLVADRAADRLATALLDGPTPSTLEFECTAAFFGAGNASGCGFSPSDPATTRVGIDARYDLNVSIRRNTSAAPGTETLCTNGTAIGACPGPTRLSIGEAVPTSHDTVSTVRRIVAVDGREATLVVRVW